MPEGKTYRGYTRNQIVLSLGLMALSLKIGDDKITPETDQKMNEFTNNFFGSELDKAQDDFMDDAEVSVDTIFEVILEELQLLENPVDGN